MESCENHTCLAKCDKLNSKHISVCLMGRGPIQAAEFGRGCMMSLKQKLNFSKTKHDRMSVGIIQNAPYGREFQKEVCQVSNTTAMKEVFKRITTRFD